MIASNLDGFSSENTSTQAKWDSIQKYMSSPPENITDDNRWATFDTTALMSAVHLVLRHALLDQLLFSFLKENNPMQLCPHSALPDALPKWMKEVSFAFLIAVIPLLLFLQHLKVLRNWIAPIEKLQNTDIRNSDPISNIFAVPLPQKPTAEQKRLILAMKFLHTGADRMSSIKVNSVLLNFESMAFAITWFGLVRVIELTEKLC